MRLSSRCIFVTWCFSCTGSFLCGRIVWHFDLDYFYWPSTWPSPMAIIYVSPCKTHANLSSRAYQIGSRLRAWRSLVIQPGFRKRSSLHNKRNVFFFLFGIWSESMEYTSDLVIDAKQLIGVHRLRFFFVWNSCHFPLTETHIDWLLNLPATDSVVPSLRLLYIRLFCCEFCGRWWSSFPTAFRQMTRSRKLL